MSRKHKGKPNVNQENRTEQNTNKEAQDILDHASHEGQYAQEAQEDAQEAADALEAAEAELPKRVEDLLLKAQFMAFVKSAETLDRCLFIVTNQAEVNSLMASPDWLEKASEHDEIDYSMAALDECQELWSCALNFKWWDRKSFKGDPRNARMELVDILHFIASEAMVEAGGYSQTQREDIAQRMVDGMEYAFMDGVRPFKEALKQFVARLSNNNIDWGAFWEMTIGLDENSKADPVAAIGHVINLYTAKATLNKFRTRYRNSAAGYRKVWVDGREDNDIMMAWLESLEVFPGAEALNHWLEQSYSRIINVGD